MTVSRWFCLATVALLGCGGEPSAPGSAAGPPGGPAERPPAGDGDAPQPASPDTILVEMRGISYQAPGGGSLVTIGLGQSVRWVNRDGTRHTVTTTIVPEGAKGFNSGPLPPGATYVFTPATTGTWEYECLEFPDRMHGARIVVSD